MAKIQKRGEKGAAKNYITRNQALKKLQLSLSDFRRLCILKGIYPREPLHKKRANKGSSAPASFYYSKDIQYLLHEPLLVRFREHKAFAKKLSRALGRGEWALAKNLEEAKPVARLDHLVKERYPTFTLALQDLQDPLNLVHLFSTLPTNPIPGKTLVPPEVISECSKLIAEWKLWAIKTHSLRHVFLGIKGIYYEVDTPGQGGDPVKVRWLEGYEFQQHVPHDVDFRILLTFLELYRTLISFVLYKLYTEENLVYPPPLDKELEDKGESVGALKLVERKDELPAEGSSKISKKEVKRAIKGIQTGASGDTDDVEMEGNAEAQDDREEDFVERPSKEENEDVVKAPLTTFSSIVASAQPSSSSSLLFSPYTFYLSREISARTWEFIIRSMGGKVITALQSPSLDLNGITHVIIDRPMTVEQMREMEKGRKWVWVQPQWVADCINKSKILGADDYAPGKLLPPHLSPWDGEGELARPWLEENGDVVGVEAEEEDVEAEDVDEDDEESQEEETPDGTSYPPALLAAAADPSDSTLRHAAELEAERNGTSHAVFEAQLKEASKTQQGATKPSKSAGKGEEDLRKIMMSNKKAKLYEKIKYSNRQKAEEKEKLEAKKRSIERRKRREGKA